MSRLHICNTFFEKELQAPSRKSLAEWMRSYPIVMQLQFLPLLYASPNDRILVSDLPENPDPRLCLIDATPPPGQIEHWGPSLAIADWAKTHRIPYQIPGWETVRELNSKVFSFSQSPQLPGSALLLDQQSIQTWIATGPHPKVLKTPFGTAGAGHIFPQGSPLKHPTPPLIGEPWVERTLDFSTQWKNGRLVGVTVFENEPNGTYKRTFAGQVEPWALDEHLKIAQPLITTMKNQGYSDHVGIDAFIYLWHGEKKVHPIVEINGRKTMSWVALQITGRELQYTRLNHGPLPTSLCVKGKRIFFDRNIALAAVSKFSE